MFMIVHRILSRGGLWFVTFMFDRVSYGPLGQLDDRNRTVGLDRTQSVGRTVTIGRVVYGRECNPSEVSLNLNPFCKNFPARFCF
jgi:hypothetical protein